MADILIRGMEMPKERSLWLCIKTDGTVYNIKPGGLGTAHAIGTALQLSEEHGRLIDADALKDIIGKFSLCWEYGQGVSDCFAALISAPTIVPAEGGGEDG